MFNKEEYWKRRKSKLGPKRGQDVVATEKFYPKGTPVLKMTKKGAKVDINRPGMHIKMEDKTYKSYNRIDARKASKTIMKYVIRSKKLDADGNPTTRAVKFTKLDRLHPGQEPLKAEELKAVPSWRRKLPANWTQPTPKEDPTMTNHDRHTLREAKRQLAKRQKEGTLDIDPFKISREQPA